MIALLTALVVLPVYPKVGLMAVPGTYVPVRLDDVIMVLLVVTWVVTLVVEQRAPRIPTIAPFAIAWILASLIAVFMGAGILRTVQWGTSFLYWAKMAEYLLLGWIAYDLVRGPIRFRVALGTMFLTASIVVAYGTLERFHLLPPAPNYAAALATRGVVGSTMGDPHQLASYLGIILLAAVALSAPSRKRLAIGLFVAIFLAAFVIVEAGARSEFLALIVALVVLATQRLSRLPAIIALVLLGAAFVLPQMAATQIGSLSPDTPAAPATSAPTGPAPTPSDVSVSNRLEGDLTADVSLRMRFEEKWPELIAIGMQDPIFGAGPSSATEAADGYYVRVFVESGVVGASAFVAFITSACLALFRAYRRTSDPLLRRTALGVLVATGFLIAVAVLIDTWVASRPMQLFWPLMGIVLGLDASTRTHTAVALTEGAAVAVR